MALELVQALARTELDDHLHMARLLMLLNAHAGKTNKPVEGVTKLAKLDFLLRYPNCLERALVAKGKPTAPACIQDFERTTIESKMVRFRYGPWDHRYRRWIALLVGKGLLHARVDGRTVKLWLTEVGHSAAHALEDAPDLEYLSARAGLVARTFGTMSGTALKNFVYATFPEIITMRWGDPITI
ncbi:hypothetical protein [Pseudomonas sp. 2FG]|uniref:hypothetical protein n=1 Tax=Pseudomonas sp. 2FG TaxID=2502191 RepID=UPI0010F74958|nr:hypothetical protein [Pseudomonas sp. 2FG]